MVSLLDNRLKNKTVKCSVFFPLFFPYGFSISTWIALFARESSKKLSSQSNIKKFGRIMPFCTDPNIARNCDGNMQTNSKGKMYISY